MEVLGITITPDVSYGPWRIQAEQYFCSASIFTATVIDKWGN